MLCLFDKGREIMKGISIFSLTMKCLVVTLLVCFNCKAIYAHHLIEASGSYVMDIGLDETPSTAQARAREVATREAARKAGVYIESYTKVINLVVEHDEINAITSQLLKIDSETCKVATVGDNLLKFTVDIKAWVEDTDAATMRDMLRDKMKLEETIRRNQELQKEYDKLQSQMKELQQQYAVATNTERKTEIKNLATQNSAYFHAAQALEQGNVLYANGEYQKAIDAYGTAEHFNIRSAEIYNNRGLAYYHLHDLNSALSDFDRAIDIDHEFSYAYNNRGIIYQEMSQTKNSIDDFTIALQLNPRYVYALNNRANSFMQADRLQDAIKDLQHAIRISPNYVDAHNNLGNVYLTLKDYEKAIGEYTLAIQVNPQYAEAYYNRACALTRKKSFRLALHDAEKALALMPNDEATITLYEQINEMLKNNLTYST